MPDGYHRMRNRQGDPSSRQLLEPGALQRSLRCLGERGFALLNQRWRTLQHISASPSKIGAIARAALVLTHVEHGYYYSRTLSWSPALEEPTAPASAALADPHRDVGGFQGLVHGTRQVIFDRI